MPRRSHGRQSVGPQFHGLTSRGYEIDHDRGSSRAGRGRGFLTLPPGADTVRRLMLKRTPFHDFHVQCGAKLVDFAGWEMPILYRSIVDEHEQTRSSGSIFDVSHMGRLQFSGKDAAAFLDRV